MGLKEELDTVVNDGVYLAVRQKPDGELPAATLSRAQLRLIIDHCVQRAARLALSQTSAAFASDHHQQETERRVTVGTFFGRNRQKLIAVTLLAIGAGVLVGELIHQRDGSTVIATVLIGLGYVVLTDRKRA